MDATNTSRPRYKDLSLIVENKRSCPTGTVRTDRDGRYPQLAFSYLECFPSGYADP